MLDDKMHDVVIVGGGLSGLMVANYLEEAGVDWHLVEARERTGGRIFSPKDAAGAAYDMGPAWIWPHQRRIQALAKELGLSIMPQYVTGKLAFEDGQGQVRRDLDFAMMGGTLRVAGGLQAVTSGVQAKLPSDKITTGKAITHIRKAEGGFALSVGDGFMDAQQVVLALPPRLAATRIDLSAVMPDAALTAMKHVPTWMAAHGKLVVTYKTPFWREIGLSGEGMSHRGPLMEIHDAGPAEGTGALFGFIHPEIVAAGHSETALKQAILEQLSRMFGAQAAQPEDIFLKLWFNEEYTATPADAGNHQHPHGGLGSAMRAVEGSGIFFAGSEVAPEEPGLVEGAIASAQAVVQRMPLETLRSKDKESAALR